MRNLGIALFLFLLAVYTLTYSGVFHSDDEMSVAAVAESLVKRGEVNIDQLRWNQDMSAGIGKYGSDGRLYSKYGWGAPVAAVPFYLAALLLPPLGNVQAIMLLNAVVTALSGLLVWRAARRLGMGDRGGVALALLYGLSTLAWVYAKYFFGEPLSGLGLLAAFYSLLCYRDEHHARDLLWAGLSLGAAVAIKTANLAAVPIFLLQLVFYVPGLRFQASGFRFQVSRLAFYAIPLLLPIILVALITGGYNLFRFGDPLEAGYLPIERFSGRLQEGILGLLFSPGRGLVFYAPILLLLIPAFTTFWRRWRMEALVVALLAISQTLLYAGWHVWFGGWCWGPRFLVPTLPFLVLALGPWLETVWQNGLPQSRHVMLNTTTDENIRHNRSAARPRARLPHQRPATGLPADRTVPFRGYFHIKIVVVSLAIVSGMVQVLGLSVDFNRYLLSLLEQFPGLGAGVAYMTVDVPRLSPLLGQLGQLSLHNLDFAWLRVTDGAVWIDWRILGPALTFVLLAGGYLWARININTGAVRTQQESVSIHVRPCPDLFSGWLLAATLLMGGVALWQASAWGDGAAHYGPVAHDYQIIFDRIQAASRLGDVLWLVAPERSDLVLNANKARLPVYAPLQEKWPLKPDTQSLLSGLSAKGGRLWLVTEDDPNASSGYEHWLALHGHKVAEETVGPAIVSLYAFPPPGAQEQPSERVGRTFGGQIRLEGYTIWPWPARPGQAVQVTLFWQATQAPLPNYRVSVNLTDANNQLIWQRDSDPVEGFRPTSTWLPGEIVVDRRGFLLPMQVPAGEYRLGVAVYDAQSGQALSLEDGNQRLAIGVTVGR